MTAIPDTGKVTRGRGRPRKNDSQATTNEKNVNRSDSEKINPPQQRTDSKRNTSVDTNDMSVDTAPKRGRRPNVAKPPSVKNADTKPTPHVERDFDKATPHENTEKKASRNTSGRPPKAGRPPNIKHTAKEEILAISMQKREALPKSDVLELEQHSMNLPMHVSQNSSDVEMNRHNLDRKTTNRGQRGRKSYSKNNDIRQNDASQNDTRHNEPSVNRDYDTIDPRASDADFVGGAFGVSVYGGDESLGGYGERGALGVLGLADEAPNMDAVLPLVDKQKIDDVSQRDTETNANFTQPKTYTKSKGRFAKNKLSAPAVSAPEINVPSDMAESVIEEVATHTDRDKKHKKVPKQTVSQEAPPRRVLYVSAIPDEQVEVVITENGVVSEYFVEMAHQVKIRGNIYKGIINNVDTNLQAAFVNFGGGKNGFLQIDEVHPEYWLTHHTEGAKYPPIQKVLRVGQEVLVQVVKEPSGSKGAFLTTWLSLAGRFLVLTPGQEQIGVSRKVEDNEERERLRELLSGINPGEDMGVIIRTASEGASKTSIQKDLKFLKNTWKDVQRKVVSEKAPSIIHQESDLASRAVRDYLTDDVHEVWVDSEDMQNALKDLVQAIYPRSKDILKRHNDSKSTLWERFNILRQLDDVTKREVNLPSGGRLVFDQTEALMAIDINSGKTHGKTNFESMVFRTNMEAAEAIARHLRLRDIGGQVVIDFIEMRDRGHTRDVEKCLRNAMKRDRARHDLGKISSFGLLELVRQRTGTSAISLSSEPCPHCHGTGFRRNMEWQAQGVLRDIKSKLSAKHVTAKYVHEINHDVGLYLLNKKRDRLCELETIYDIKIEIRLR